MERKRGRERVTARGLSSCLPSSEGMPDGEAGA